MTVRFRMFMAAAAFAFIGGGCAVAPAPAPVVQLNDPARSKALLDVANLLPPRNIPFETAEQGGILVGYNLLFSKSANISGYRLTLVFKNNSHSTQRLEPLVSLRDAAGVLIPPYSYPAFTAEAAALAGIVVPPMTCSCESARYYSAGTISATALDRGNAKAGITTSTLGGGSGKGTSHGAASGAANDREGLLMLLWADAFWLKDAYELPAGATSSGALFFPAAVLGQLPLRLAVEVGGQRYEFVTTAMIGHSK